MATPIGAQAARHDPEQAIPSAKLQERLGAERDDQLLPEERVLQREVSLAAEEGTRHADSEAQPLEHGRRMPDGESARLTDALLAPFRYFRYRLSLADARDPLAERGIDVSAGTVLSWAHRFGPLLAAAARAAARPVGRRWWTDETYVRVAGCWAYLYRAVDEHGPVIDVLLRERRDLASARAFFDQATARRGVRPRVLITDKHPAYRRAVRRRAWRAIHIRTGLHHARGATTKAVERSHVPVKDRLRPMRGLQSVATGQRLPEGIELAHAVRRGHVRPEPERGRRWPSRRPHTQARDAVTTFTWPASRLLRAA
jgi:transposase, IS6 family